MGIRRYSREPLDIKLRRIRYIAACPIRVYHSRDHQLNLRIRLQRGSVYHRLYFAANQGDRAADRNPVYPQYPAHIGKSIGKHIINQQALIAR